MPHMTLSDFVSKNGGTKGISKKFGVTRNAVYAWTSKKVLPHPLMMQRIVKTSGGRVTYDGMINAYRSVKALRKKKTTKKKTASKSKSK
jgi:hypothetical protein